MSSSGIEPTQEVKEHFKAFKDSKSSLTYIIFKIKDDKEIVIDKEAENATFEDLKDVLIAGGAPRYAAMKLGYTLTDNTSVREKIVFIYFCLDTYKVKEKMVYASSKDKLIQTLGSGSFAKVIQVSDESEMDENAMIVAVSKNRTT